MSKQDLTVQKVLDVKKLNLSLENSAAKLGVVSTYLKKFILRNNINWIGIERGKRPINLNSDLQKCKKLNINYQAVKYRQYVFGLSFDEAVNVVLESNAK